MSEKEDQTDSKVLLVTPVWRDADRLARFGTQLAHTLADTAHHVEWVIADDGSEKEERTKLRELLEQLTATHPNTYIHFADIHRGKGAVVRETWSLHPEADWLAFVDADGSLAPKELIRMINTAIKSNQSVMGIRKRTATTDVSLSLPRAIAHRLFILAVKILVGVRCEDPQCGAKILKASDFRAVAPSLEEPGLAFDAELLAALKAQGASWTELPVSWVEKDGGKVRPIRDAWGMLAALWKVRIRQRNGEFNG